MPKQKRVIFNKLLIFIMLVTGITTLLVSAVYSSSFLAILGVALIFWGGILLYIAPTKQVSIVLLNKVVNTQSSNIERILTHFKFTEKGVYLPPKNLKTIESSLIFIPETSNTPLPTPEQTTENLASNQKGVFITPPGIGLLEMFEQEMSTSFVKTGTNDLNLILPKLLIEKLCIAGNIEIKILNDTVTIEVTDSVFSNAGNETSINPRTHKQIGSLLASAFACILAKTTGKSVTVQNEILNQKTKITTMEFKLGEK